MKAVQILKLRYGNSFSKISEAQTHLHLITDLLVMKPFLAAILCQLVSIEINKAPKNLTILKNSHHRPPFSYTIFKRLTRFE